MLYTLKNQHLCVTISDVGAELMRVDGTNGTSYLWEGDEAYWGDRAPLLFPVCGSLLNKGYDYKGKHYSMKSHGFLPKYPMTAQQCSDEQICFSCTETAESLAVYPFPFALMAEYRLSENVLCLDVTVKNTGEDVLPFMFGWHPGFSTTGKAGETLEDYVIRTRGVTEAELYPLTGGPFVSKTAERRLFAGETFPLSHDSFHPAIYDTLIFKDLYDVELACDKTGKRVRMTTSRNLPYLCLWKADDKNAHFLCIEPWSGIPGDGTVAEDFATRDHMVRLAPGAEETFSYRVELIG